MCRGKNRSSPAFGLNSALVHRLGQRVTAHFKNIYVLHHAVKKIGVRYASNNGSNVGLDVD